MKMAYLTNVVSLKLDGEACIGCGRCLEVCPHGVFGLEQGKSRILDRDACMECGACARNCPVNVLWVKNGVGCAIGILNSVLGRKSACCGEDQACCCSEDEPETEGKELKMNEQNKEQKPETETCGTGCSCGNSGSGSRGRWIVGIVILIVAGLLVARAMVKDNGAPSAPASAGFATLSKTEQTAVPGEVAMPPVTDALKEIAGLSELNTVAGDSFGVFVYLPGKGETSGKVPLAQMQGAARTIEPQLRGGKISLFTLKMDSRDYEQVSSQMAVPGVLALVKGKGMSATSGDITETKLVQALVTAANAGGGCGPSSAGCGPGASSCN